MLSAISKHTKVKKCQESETDEEREKAPQTLA